MRREPVVEGLFYPDSPEELRRIIREALSQTTATRTDAAVIVAPHGYISYTRDYVAAAMRAAATINPEVVVVLGSTGVPADRRVLLPESDLFATPLGDLPVDHIAVEELLHSGTHFVHDEIAHLRDHSVEVQLPWVRHLFGEVPIVPLLVGRLTVKLATATAAALRLAVRGRRPLVVVSANLSSFATVEESFFQKRRVINALYTSGPDSVYTVLSRIAPRPSATDVLAVGHILAGGCRLELLKRGTIEVEVDGGVGAVACGALAYFTP